MQTYVLPHVHRVCYWGSLAPTVASTPAIAAATTAAIKAVATPACEACSARSCCALIGVGECVSKFCVRLSAGGGASLASTSVCVGVPQPSFQSQRMTATISRSGASRGMGSPSPVVSPTALSQNRARARSGHIAPISTSTTMLKSACGSDGKKRTDAA